MFTSKVSSVLFIANIIVMVITFNSFHINDYK